jgi:hypothetical protein
MVKKNYYLDHSLWGSCSDDEVKRLPCGEWYAARAYGITKPGDVIVLPRSLEEDLAVIRRHYRQMGIQTTAEVRWNGVFGDINQYEELTPSVYYFSQRHNEVSRCDSWCEAASFSNSKNNFIRFLQEREEAVPVTHLYGMFDPKMRFENVRYPAFLKLDVSASGEGVWRVSSESEALEQARTISGPFQLQEEEKGVFLNVQYEIQDGVARRLFATEQLLEGTAYCGSLFPTKYDPYPFCDGVAQALAVRGLSGVVGFDIVALPGGGFKWIECNPRYNGSSYPGIIASRLGLERWAYKTARHSLKLNPITPREP